MISRTIDKLIIPPFLTLQTRYWLKVFPELSRYSPQKVFLNEGHQTKDYLKDYINRHHPIKKSKILLLGCGKGKEAVDWIRWEPASIKGIDYFNYSIGWKEIMDKVRQSSEMNISFQQADILSDQFRLNENYDIISSDAVFEHITDLDKALSNLSSLLSPSGIIYASFGPLYYTLGGDHYSGWDGIQNGYNHLVLEKSEYDKYVQKKDTTNKDDDRIFIYNNLFSRLKVAEYIYKFSKYFSFMDLKIGLSPKALKFRKNFPLASKNIIKNHGLDEMDLLIKCLFMVATKKQPKAKDECN